MRHDKTVIGRGLVALCLGLGFSSSVSAEELTGLEIAHRSNLMTYYQGRDGRSHVRMVITDAQKRERERRLTILRWDAAETDSVEGHAYLSEQKFYVYFHRPADVKKTVFMVWKRLDQDDDRWLFLPALDLVKRIAATDKRTSFVGSDFFYEDVSGRRVDDDNHELVETTDNYYVLNSTPKDPSSVEFSRYRMFIHKKTFLPIRTEFLDTNGDKYRVYTVKKVEDIQSHPTVVQATMENMLAGTKTEFTFSNVSYDNGLEEKLFTERYLRRPPLKKLR
jgi:hypothetical protein